MCWKGYKLSRYESHGKVRQVWSFIEVYSNRCLLLLCLSCLLMMI